MGNVPAVSGISSTSDQPAGGAMYDLEETLYNNDTGAFNSILSRLATDSGAPLDMLTQSGERLCQKMLKHRVDEWRIAGLRLYLFVLPHLSKVGDQANSRLTSEVVEAVTMLALLGSEHTAFLSTVFDQLAKSDPFAPLLGTTRTLSIMGMLVNHSAESAQAIFSALERLSRHASLLDVLNGAAIPDLLVKSLPGIHTGGDEAHSAAELESVGSCVGALAVFLADGRAVPCGEVDVVFEALSGSMGAGGDQAVEKMVRFLVELSMARGLESTIDSTGGRRSREWRRAQIISLWTDHCVPCLLAAPLPGPGTPLVACHVASLLWLFSLNGASSLATTTDGTFAKVFDLGASDGQCMEALLRTCDWLTAQPALFRHSHHTPLVRFLVRGLVGVAPRLPGPARARVAECLSRLSLLSSDACLELRGPTAPPALFAHLEQIIGPDGGAAALRTMAALLADSVVMSAVSGSPGDLRDVLARAKGRGGFDPVGTRMDQCLDVLASPPPDALVSALLQWWVVGSDDSTESEAAAVVSLATLSRVALHTPHLVAPLVTRVVLERAGQCLRSGRVAEGRAVCLFLANLARAHSGEEGQELLARLAMDSPANLLADSTCNWTHAGRASLPLVFGQGCHSGLAGFPLGVVRLNGSYGVTVLPIAQSAPPLVAWQCPGPAPAAPCDYRVSLSVDTAPACRRRTLLCGGATGSSPILYVDEEGRWCAVDQSSLRVVQATRWAAVTDAAAQDGKSWGDRPGWQSVSVRTCRAERAVTVRVGEWESRMESVELSTRLTAVGNDTDTMTTPLGAIADFRLYAVLDSPLDAGVAEGLPGLVRLTSLLPAMEGALRLSVDCTEALLHCLANLATSVLLRAEIAGRFGRQAVALSCEPHVPGIRREALRLLQNLS